MQRNTRSPAFKKKVALEALKEYKSINEVAKEFEVHPVQVRQWKKELIEGSEDIFRASGKKQSSRSDEISIAQLEQKIGQLTVENDWLKKKLQM